jgi:hypothetical protein
MSRLHALAASGWGIADGLEVVSDPSRPQAMIVRPGLALDATGRMLLLADPVRLDVPHDVPAVLHVVLTYAEEPIAPQRAWSDRDEYTRVLERAHVCLEAGAPTPPGLELARLRFDGPVRNAVDPVLPRRGELDLRFRERLHVRPRPDLGVAQLVVEPDERAGTAERHRQGLRYLLREIGLTTPYRPRWAGSIGLDEPLPPVSLIYLTGSGSFGFSNELVPGLAAFLLGGGVLFADACLATDWQAFAGSVKDLANRLRRTPLVVERGHPLLLSRHVLTEPPLACDEGPAMSESGGLVLTTADYGCAWQGGSAEHALSRETVRASLELGTNIAVYGRRRQHPLDVLELEA